MQKDHQAMARAPAAGVLLLAEAEAEEAAAEAAGEVLWAGAAGACNIGSSMGMASATQVVLLAGAGAAGAVGSALDMGLAAVGLATADAAVERVVKVV